MTDELLTRFQEVGSQEQTSNPLIICKYFNPCGAGTWYATEYEPEDNICFGYVTGLGYDEWGYFSLDEMKALKLPFGLSIERDLHFGEKQFSEVIKK